MAAAEFARWLCTGSHNAATCTLVLCLYVSLNTCDVMAQGFVKVAVETGASLVPVRAQLGQYIAAASTGVHWHIMAACLAQVISFGENNMFHVTRPDKNSLAARVQRWVPPFVHAVDFRSAVSLGSLLYHLPPATGGLDPGCLQTVMLCAGRGHAIQYNSGWWHGCC